MDRKGYGIDDFISSTNRHHSAFIFEKFLMRAVLNMRHPNYQPHKSWKS